MRQACIMSLTTDTLYHNHKILPIPILLPPLPLHTRFSKPSCTFKIEAFPITQELSHNISENCDPNLHHRSTNMAILCDKLVLCPSQPALYHKHQILSILCQCLTIYQIIVTPTFITDTQIWQSYETSLYYVPHN